MLQGDKIYIFGFSRGAFTAKFLARMIHRVGLLYRGNEEMVPFALRLYMNYLTLANIIEKKKKKRDKDVFNYGTTTGIDEMSQSDEEDEGDDGHISDIGFAQLSADQTLLAQDISKDQLSGEFKEAINKIRAFKHTFCRKDQGNVHESERNIKVFFLGIWDAVNSVAVLEQTASRPVPVLGTARYVRHSVSVDERRVKFKPALLAQDIRIINNLKKGNNSGEGISRAAAEEDIKEVWFPGNHGDVGGGWPSEPPRKLTMGQKIKGIFTTDKPKNAPASPRDDPFQLSDISLAWMIRELELVGKKHPEASVEWSKWVEGFKKRLHARKEQALTSFVHDPLRFSFGTAFIKVVF